MLTKTWDSLLVGRKRRGLFDEDEDGEGDSEYLKALLALGCLLLMAISAYQTWNEFRYAVWGLRTSGEVTELKTTDYLLDGNRKTYHFVHVSYHDQAGEDVRFYQSVSQLSRFQAGQELEVQYIPGQPASARIWMLVSYGWVACFFCCVHGLVGIVAFYALEAQRPYTKHNGKIYTD